MLPVNSECKGSNLIIRKNRFKAVLYVTLTETSGSIFSKNIFKKRKLETYSIGFLAAIVQKLVFLQYYLFHL